MAIKINGNTVIADNQNITSTGDISAVGQITGGNINSNGNVGATGNINGNNINALSGDITGNVIVSGSGEYGILPGQTVLSLSNARAETVYIGAGKANLLYIGNSQSNTNFGGNISVAGNITAGNITANVTTSTISASGNVTGGNLRTAGAITATGNITGNYFIGNGSQLTGIDATAIQNGTANVRTFNNGNVTTSAGGTANVLNVTSTGTITTGTASVSGTVTGGNIATAGTVSATGNATAGNVLTSGLVSATGNVQAGNIRTAGLVSATGNVTGGNILTAGDLSLSGNIVDSGPLTITTGSGNITLNPTGNVSLNNKNINNLAQPSADQDAATKIYVDNAVSTSISYHQPVVAATTANLATTTGGTITYNQPNGAGNGIGATITTTGSFNLIDTANVQTANTRILVKDEGNAVLNGVYIWSNATVITRATDTNTYGAGNVNALGLNDYFFVSSGNVNKGSAYVVSAPTGTITFGTSNITFAQFSSSQTYTANTSAGISLNGTVINGKVDGVTTAFDGGGNISVKASANLTTPNIGAATGTSLSTTGNVTGGNILTGGLISATGNITGNFILGNGSQLTGIDATSIQSGTSNVRVVSSGGNVAMGIGGTANVVVVATTGQFVTGVNSVSGNITGGNVLTAGLISATSTITSAANVTGGNILTAGLISATGNVSGGNLNVTGNIVDTGALSIITGSNGNIALAPNGTGIVTVSSALSATGNITGNFFIGNGSQLTGIDATAIQNGTANVRTFLNGNVTTSAAGTANVLNVTSTGTITTGTASVSGTVTGGNIATAGTVSATGAITGAAITGTSLTVSTGNVTAGNIVNGNANGVGNIGSSTTYFNTVFAKATSAQYADLAEKYTADADYAPGTVVMFGGSAEVTLCVADGCSRVAGVISTNPSYIMNGTLEAAHVATVALTGRVPTKVTGTVRKGDLMVSAGNGLARAEANPGVGTVIGKALADHNGEDGVIEVVVGRF